MQTLPAWQGRTDSGGEPIRFRNHYHCPRCESSWSDEWSCACDDECPCCSLDCTPEFSEELDENGDVIADGEPHAGEV